MIARIEFDFSTGQVKYFDENEIEIDPEIAKQEIGDRDS